MKNKQQKITALIAFSILLMAFMPREKAKKSQFT